MTIDSANLDRAVTELDAVSLPDGRYAHYAAGTSRWYIVSAADLARLVSYLDHEDEEIRSDAYSHWCAGTVSEEQERGWDPEHPDHVHCECGQFDGHSGSCDWWGPTAETVVVEYMPEYLRASHEAAGNAGTYPHNGAERIRCERSCADRLAHVWDDGEQTAALDPYVTIVEAQS